MYEHLKDISRYNWTLIEDNENEIKNNKIIIPAYKTKGLEFDCSIVYDCSFNKYEDNELDKKVLYVALTRALHSEFILFKDKISELLV
ncbi:ATP-binding domain-containing protein [Clostridium sp. DL1XJH146]